MKFLEEDRASRAEPQSVILSGDMNSNETSAAIATLRSGTGTAQLVDTYREFHPEPREMQATSHPAWFAEEATSSGDHPTPPFGKRIDFIFASTAAFEVVEAMIDRFEDKAAATSEGSGMGKADGRGRYGRGRFPSDHFAVLAILQYRNDPSRLVKRSSLDTNPRAARHELTTAMFVFSSRHVLLGVLSVFSRYSSTVMLVP